MVRHAGGDVSQPSRLHRRAEDADAQRSGLLEFSHRAQISIAALTACASAVAPSPDAFRIGAFGPQETQGVRPDFCGIAVPTGKR